MGGGAWPFLVGGVICLVNSVNERDLNLLNSDTKLRIAVMLSSNDDVMCDYLGCVSWITLAARISVVCVSLLRGTVACLTRGSLRQ